MIAPLQEEKFTHDDYYDLFVPRELIEPMRLLQGEVNQEYASQQFTVMWPADHGYELEVSLRNEGHGRPFVLKAPRLLQHHSNALLHERVTSWVRRRAQVGVDFGHVHHVLKQLAEKCATASQVRFFWPQVVPLAQLTHNQELVEKLLAPVPKSVPGLPIPLRVACRKTAGTLAAAHLFPDIDYPKSWDSPMTFEVSPCNVKEEGMTFGAIR
jgi:hypothetical protein